MCRLHVGARRERRQVKIHELCADGRRRVTFANDLRLAVLLNAFELCDASQCCALVVVVAVHVSTLLWCAVSRARTQPAAGLIARGCHKRRICHAWTLFHACNSPAPNRATHTDSYLPTY